MRAVKNVVLKWLMWPIDVLLPRTQKMVDEFDCTPNSQKQFELIMKARAAIEREMQSAEQDGYTGRGIWRLRAQGVCFTVLSGQREIKRDYIDVVADSKGDAILFFENRYGTGIHEAVVEAELLIDSFAVTETAAANIVKWFR